MASSQRRPRHGAPRMLLPTSRKNTPSSSARLLPALPPVSPVRKNVQPTRRRRRPRDMDERLSRRAPARAALHAGPVRQLHVGPPPSSPVLLSPGDISPEDDGEGESCLWQKMFPETAPGEPQEPLPPTSFGPAVGVTLHLPAEAAPLAEEDRFVERVHGMLASGEALSVAMGNDGTKVALKCLSQQELVLWDRWERGQALPRMDWRGFEDLEFPDPDPNQPWPWHAESLNDVYDVDCVDEQLARAWWLSNVEWRPFLTAYGAVKKYRLKVEARALKACLARVQACQDNIALITGTYTDTTGEAMFILDEILKWLEKDYHLFAPIACRQDRLQNGDVDGPAANEVAEDVADEAPDKVQGQKNGTSHRAPGRDGPSMGKNDLTKV